MARKPRLSKGKTMHPNYFVFCEGDTDVRYVEMLRSLYRQPVHIIAFTKPQQSFLKNNTDVAVERARNLQELQNPSTGIYKLIELLKGLTK